MAFSANGGELIFAAYLGATRHQPSASAVGNFHRTGESMGDIIAQHTHRAVQGATMAVCDGIHA